MINQLPKHVMDILNKVRLAKTKQEYIERLSIANEYIANFRPGGTQDLIKKTLKEFNTMQPLSSTYQARPYMEMEKKKSISRSRRAGLIFPVGRTHRLVKNEICTGSGKTRVGAGAPVYIAAVLEYLLAEVLELAGNAASDRRRKRITARHITLAVRSDEELHELFRNVNIPQGGTMPMIHAVLIPKASKSKRGQQR
jgi:histone H2A